MITIRRAEPADLEFLRAFAEHTFRITYEAQNDPKAFNDYCAAHFTPEKMEAEFRHPYSAFYLACLNDERVAYLKLNFDQHPPEIGSERSMQVQRIYIAPAYQGQGIGRQLLDFAQQCALAADLDWVWLSVWKKAPATVAFYEHCGFEICGMEWFPLGDDPQEDWIMRRSVNDEV